MNRDTKQLDTNLNSLQLIEEFQRLNIICPKPNYWDAIWTLIYVKNKQIFLPPKGSELNNCSEERKRELFFTHIKLAEKYGTLNDVISFINKTKLNCFRSPNISKKVCQA